MTAPTTSGWYLHSHSGLFVLDADGIWCGTPSNARIYSPGDLPLDDLLHVKIKPAQETTSLERAAIKLANRFAAKGMILTANEVLREVGLPERRWA